jgi:hypothetical protein
LSGRVRGPSSPSGMAGLTGRERRVSLATDRIRTCRSRSAAKARVSRTLLRSTSPSASRASELLPPGTETTCRKRGGRISLIHIHSSQGEMEGGDRAERSNYRHNKLIKPLFPLEQKKPPGHARLMTHFRSLPPRY